MKYTRYRFKTKYKDYPHPIKNLKIIGMPYWISGLSLDSTLHITASIVICYLPKGVDIKEHWEDAFDIDSKDTNEIIYTDRFPKPYYL